MNFPKNIFMPFVVLGDPSPEESLEIIKSLIDNGAGALELGFAFSDPIADGPTIQKASNRVLAKGMTTAKGFEIVAKVREYSKIPISVMLDFNIVLNYGPDKFYAKCKELKIDAVLCPDIPIEEEEEVLPHAKKHGIHQIFLVSPTTSDERMKKIASYCTGYVYLVAVLGITGARDNLDKEIEDLISRTKKVFDIPIYVGFGISKPEHVRSVLSMGADGAIAGSAFCKMIEEGNIDGIGEFCKSMSEAAK